MEVFPAENEKIVVRGNECKRGEDYARNEFHLPVRGLTTTVRVRNGELRIVPVKANQPIPKEKIMECMEYLRKVEVEAPVKIGQVIVKNILGLGVDIIATRNLLRRKE